MKKSILFALVMVVTTAQADVLGQAPDWYRSDNRSVFYPSNVYFSGYAATELTNGLSLEDALDQVKAAASAEAASTIQVHVQSVQKDFTSSTEHSTASTVMADFYQLFETATVLSTDIEIPGLKVETHHDGKVVAAFAYVKKRDLQRQLEKQITIGLTRIETQLDNIDELVSNGQKVEARNRAAILYKDFKAVERNQELLLAVDSEADEETLQLKESNALQQRYALLMAALKNGIYIALDCEAELFGEAYPTFANGLKGELSAIGCSFTDKVMEADWIIIIRSKAREYNAATYGQYTTYFTYVDSKIELFKTSSKQTVYEDEVSVKGSHTRSYKEAARDGYKETSKKLSEKIKEEIEKY